MKSMVAAIFGLLAVATLMIVDHSPPNLLKVLVNARERSMEDPKIAAMTEMVNAVNDRDAKRYAGLYTQDAVITIYGSAGLRGRGAIEQYELELLREFPTVRLAFYAVWEKGPLAVVHYGVNGRTPGGQLMGHEGRYRVRARYEDESTRLQQTAMKLGSVADYPLESQSMPLKTELMHRLEIWNNA
jgi:uncharacterized protein (TIGR02246 family)